MLGDIFSLLMAPLEWVVTQILVFAVTAPYEHVYIAMGIGVIVLIALIWSMIPKKEKRVVSHNIERPIITVTDDEEAEAMAIIMRARA